MSVIVNLPAALRAAAGGLVSLELDTGGGTVADVLAILSTELPALHHRVVTEQGEIRPHINVFVGNEDIRWTGGLATPVADATEVHIIPAVSGGNVASADGVRETARRGPLINAPLSRHCR